MSGHWIKSNEQSKSPNRMVYLQIMSQPGHIDNSEGWLCAVTRVTRKYEVSKQPAPPKVERHFDEVALWNYVSEYTRNRERTVLVAYNLGQQLRLGKVLEIMPELGWKLRRFSLRDEAAMAVWMKDRASLIMIEAKSWLPMSLQKVASLVNIELPDKPAISAGIDSKLDWAAQSCLVLDDSIGTLKDWIKSEDMGNWRPTGAGMAWANWRHSHYTHRVLAGADVEQLALEGLSVGAGRAEAWRWGMQTEPPYIEWDLPLAYPRAALGAALPVAFFGESRNHKLDRHLMHSPERRTLIKALVHQTTPTLGVQHEGRWVWPTGTMRGWWWDDELAIAQDNGADITIERALTYRAKPVLTAWAEWIIPFIEDADSGATPLQRAAAKHWARSLIGRFGLRYEDWHREDVPVDPGIYTSQLRDDVDNITRNLMVIGKNTWLSTERKYGSDSVPSIMACIMSESRMRLWHLMNVAGLDHVIYVDTDSLICDQIGSDRLAEYVATGKGWGLRQKNVHTHLEILGVRQLITDDTRKVAGVPTTAIRTGKRQFTGDVAEGMTSAMSKGRSGVLFSTPRRFNLADVDYRRQHLADGYTGPYELVLTA